MASGGFSTSTSTPAVPSSAAVKRPKAAKVCLGVAPGPASMRPCATSVSAASVLVSPGATLPVPAAAEYFYLDARRGLHSEHLGIVLAEMQSLSRAYPDATW